MSEPRRDPFDALRAPVVPVAPDPAFAARLRGRLARTLLAPTAPTTKGTSMSIDLANRPRNGARHGDVSYITLGLPDLARGRAFYAAVLGWRFSAGSSEHGAQVDHIVPMTGLWAGEQPAGGRVHGGALGFRVHDITAAVAAIGIHGGTASDPRREPYGITAEGIDNQGIPFYLHEIPDSEPSTGGAPLHGEVEGDLSYLTMVVPDLDAARAFYGAVFGWTFDTANPGGAQVGGVAPQIGMTTASETGSTDPGVILCYRVADVAAAVVRVREAGGQAREVAQRPYGLESLCADDQGTPFYLHQL